MGGTCVNVGCIPTKLFVYAAHYHEDFEDAAGFGWSVGPRAHNWRTLIENKDKEISRLNGIYQRLLENSGCDHIGTFATKGQAATIKVKAGGCARGQRKLAKRQRFVFDQFY